MFESIKPRLVGNLCVDFIKIASMCCRSSMKSPGKRRRVDIVSDSPKRMRSAYPPKEDELHMDGVDALRTYFRVPTGMPCKNLVHLHFSGVCYHATPIFVATPPPCRCLGRRRSRYHQPPTEWCTFQLGLRRMLRYWMGRSMPDMVLYSVTTVYPTENMRELLLVVMLLLLSCTTAMTDT